MLDENKWLAARHGLEGTLVDLPDTGRVPVPELARRLLERMRPHAEELGSTDELDAVEDILENGNGAARQSVVYEANHDLREVVSEIIEATVPETAEAPGE
jgi:carboxylate-amine ligase